MNKKFLLALTLGVFTLSGCAAFNSQSGDSCPDGADCDTGAYVSKQVAPTNAPSPCDYNYLDAACQEQFTNYTRVAADYRQYGERDPRDIRVSQAAAGNNMTAVIPPSIENEVVEYTNTEITTESYENIGEETVEPTTSDETVDQVEDWIAEEGQNLKSLLSEWSDRAGWRLVWDTNRNYTLTAGAMFRGTFADVASALIRAFARARPAPVATFYKGNRVLVVETMEDENAYN